MAADASALCRMMYCVNKKARYHINPYIGHDSQCYGIEEHRLVGGKGDGMRLLEIRNGKGLELTVSPDRGADISRLRCRGVNLSYFSPCGYVGPAYYESEGAGWLKSFTAGFLTTCGLRVVGSPCVDEREPHSEIWIMRLFLE